MSIVSPTSEPQITKPGTVEFAHLIRTWIHYDNLSSSLAKQGTNARSVRDKYQNVIIDSLKNSNATNAIIQTSGGKIQVSNEKTQQHLSMGLIQELMHAYFKTSGKEDSTDSIIAFIKTNRPSNTVHKLKKS